MVTAAKTSAKVRKIIQTSKLKIKNYELKITNYELFFCIFRFFVVPLQVKLL